MFLIKMFLHLSYRSADDVGKTKLGSSYLKPCRIELHSLEGRVFLFCVIWKVSELFV